MPRDPWSITFLLSLVVVALTWLAGRVLPISRAAWAVIPTIRELRRGRRWSVGHRVVGRPDFIASRHFTSAAAARELRRIGDTRLEIIQTPRPIRRRRSA